MRPTRRYLVLATALLALVALAVAADDLESSSVEPAESPVLIPIETPQGIVTLVSPPGRSTSPDLLRQRSAGRTVELSRLQGLVATAPPTLCTAQGLVPGSGNAADTCGFGAEIAHMNPCPAADPEECAAYRAWSERFGAPEALPAPVELPIERADNRP